VKTPGPQSTFTVDGRRVPFLPGDSIAIAQLRQGLHPGLGGVVCLAGDCPNCLCSVDGVGFVRSCLMPASGGLDVRRHAAADHDVPVPADRGAASRIVRHERVDKVLIDAESARRVIGIYPGPQVVVAEAAGTAVIEAGEVEIRAGTAELHPVCQGNHLPGIYTGDAAAIASAAGVELGRVVVVGQAGGFPGSEVVERGDLLRIEGDDRVRGVVVRGAETDEFTHPCDTVVFRGGRHPRDALARMLEDPAVHPVEGVARTDELPDPPTDGTVCPCSGVTVDDLRSAWSRGFDEVELMKRATLAGTGTCQGSVCLPHLRSFVEANGGGRGASAFTARPVFRQITMAEASVGAWFEPVKRTALDGEHRALGARMERSGGWWRPWSYGDADREYLAVRQGVGIGDVSSLAKIWVGGADAASFLERVYPVRIDDLAIGRMRHSLLLDERGHVFDDGLVCREAADRFLLTSTTAGATGMEMWLRDWADTWGADVRIMERTDALGGINLTGPRARHVLVDLGVDADSLPGPMRFADVTIAGVLCRVMRSAFTGEVSFELLHEAEASVTLWRALSEAGAPHGIEPHGLEALLRLRLDKGHVVVGLDTELDSTPRRLGLSTMVDRSKPGFIGKEMLMRNEGFPLDRQLVGLEMEGLAPVDGSVLLVEGELVGHVTSTAWSPPLERTVALAWLEVRDDGLPEAVECDGHVARRVSTPFLDPAGERARA
jgi:glycine cleavage system aminomethyltransferase T